MYSAFCIGTRGSGERIEKGAGMEREKLEREREREEEKREKEWKEKRRRCDKRGDAKRE